jgi:hypothetical protein
VARKHRLRRILALAAVITALAAAFQPANAAGAGGFASSTVSIGSQPASAASMALAAGSQAEDAINTITAPVVPADVLRHIPADFSRVMGYEPTIGRMADGTPIAVNPNGGCSVIGGGRPFDLDVPCKAHDLGYDLLRYAHREGADLSPRARHLVDDKFGSDLFAQCGTLYSGAESGACDLMATSFDAGVGFNSWRQEFGAPIAAAGQVRTVGVLALAAILLYFATRRMLQFTARSVRAVARRRRPGPLALDVAAA